MKLMRLAICVAAFAVVGGIAMSEDMDVKALQAKLAAQEARLNDLQAKMYSASCSDGTVADGLTSLRKNAVITLGGTVNTRYFYRSGEVKSIYNNVNPGVMMVGGKSRGGDLFVADAKIEGKIDVNDNFDAYFKIDLQGDSLTEPASNNAEQYWVRWKNICNSGFGVLVGRDSLKYGMGPSVGVLDSWSGTTGGNAYNGMFDYYAAAFTGIGSRMNGAGNMSPMHTGWDYGRVTQINPYWENCDGTLKAELSFFQSVNEKNGVWYDVPGTPGSHFKRRSLKNDGWGSMSGRITWKPIEGLKLVASVLNQHNRNAKDANWWGDDGAKNNTAASFGFEYNPAFLCNRLTLWGYYQHGWNEGWVDNMSSDLINAGIKFGFTDQFYAFVQGDWIRTKDKDIANYAGNFYKGQGWAAYAGFGYVLPYGVNFEAGYRHEKVDYKDSAGDKHTKYKSNTVYAHLGFNF